MFEGGHKGFWWGVCNEWVYRGRRGLRELRLRICISHLAEGLIRTFVHCTKVAPNHGFSIDWARVSSSDSEFYCRFGFASWVERECVKFMRPS